MTSELPAVTVCRALRGESFLSLFLLKTFSDEGSPYVVPQQAGQRHSRAVGGKVHPVSASAFRAGGLEQFDTSAHQHRTGGSSGNQVFRVDGAVAEQIFHPEKRRQSSVHADMDNLVEIRDFVHVCLGRGEE